MIEKIFNITSSKETKVEKLIMDENIHYINMIFEKNNGLPEHFANSTVYMTVNEGVLSIKLDNQEVKKYTKGTVLKIPYNTKMNVRNEDEEILNLIVIKAPAPGKWINHLKEQNRIELRWPK